MHDCMHSCMLGCLLASSLRLFACTLASWPNCMLSWFRASLIVLLLAGWLAQLLAYLFALVRPCLLADMRACLRVVPLVCVVACFPCFFVRFMACLCPCSFVAILLECLHTCMHKRLLACVFDRPLTSFLVWSLCCMLACFRFSSSKLYLAR